MSLMVSVIHVRDTLVMARQWSSLSGLVTARMMAITANNASVTHSAVWLLRGLGATGSTWAGWPARYLEPSH